jgi:hypothetical protein
VGLDVRLQHIAASMTLHASSSSSVCQVWPVWLQQCHGSGCCQTPADRTCGGREACVRKATMRPCSGP